MNEKYFVHETSIVDTHASIGRNTRIWQFCNIMGNVSIGEDCNIGQNVFVEAGVKIGNRVKIKNNISIYQGVECEDSVFLGPNCVFTNVINPRSFIEKKDQIKKTIVKRGATIGANATIVCGNSIGRYAMIGAGSVVTKDINDYELVVGNPSRKIGYVCICGERLKECGKEFDCKVCGRKYEWQNDKLQYRGNEDGIY